MENQTKTPSNNQQRVQTLAQTMLDAVAQNQRFSEPTKVDDYTLITVSEIGAAIGVGTAFGLDGGGGTSMGRSVAVVSIGPDGVQVKPVFDLTKVILALLTTIGSMALMFSKIRQAVK